MAIHDQGLVEGFIKKYGVKSLVYYEFHDTFEAAIRRESQLKKWRRAWKIRLIESMNPEWTNLFDPDSGRNTRRPCGYGATRHFDVVSGVICVDGRLRGHDGGEAASRYPSPSRRASVASAQAAKRPSSMARRIAAISSW